MVYSETPPQILQLHPGYGSFHAPLLFPCAAAHSARRCSFCRAAAAHSLRFAAAHPTSIVASPSALSPLPLSPLALSGLSGCAGVWVKGDLDLW